MELENSKGNGMSVSVAIQCVEVYRVFINRIQCIDGIDCGDDICYR